VRYTSAFNAIAVNLLQGVASGQDIGSDTLSAIENLIGGKAGDTLVGDAQANVIDGHTGNDSITGGGGNDTLDGGEGQDTAVYALAASNYTVTATATGYQVAAKSGAEGTDQLRQVESLQFADRAGPVASFLASGGNQAKFWKNASLTPSETNKAAAVNLTDAISVLKMIVGLPVNSNNAPLVPHQSIAADFNQNGQVGLDDAIGMLKLVVGLDAPSPTWRYYDADKLKTSVSAAEALAPASWANSARIDDPTTTGVRLVGVLTGDVDGSWAG
jgi:Ca2+-binding RTX toxin-like protein